MLMIVVSSLGFCVVTLITIAAVLYFPGPKKVLPEAEHSRSIRLDWRPLGSGLIDHIQKMTIAAIAIADKKVWAHRS
jgi:hypothetical protein